MEQLSNTQIIEELERLLADQHDIAKTIDKLEHARCSKIQVLLLYIRLGTAMDAAVIRRLINEYRKKTVTRHLTLKVSIS